MGFAADGTGVDIGAALDFLGMRRRTGKLTIIAEHEVIGIFLDRGRMVCATSSHDNARLGETLVRQGVLVPERLTRTLSDLEGASPRAALGAVLVADGLVSRRDLVMAVEEQCVDALARILCLHDAVVLFDAQEPPPTALEIVVVNTERALAEASRRRDDHLTRSALGRLSPHPDEPLALAVSIAEIALVLGDNEILVAVAINRTPRTLRQLTEHLEMDEMTVRRTLVRLQERGYLRFNRVDA